MKQFRKENSVGERIGTSSLCVPIVIL